jgi:cyclophilin family peptidyl-prolyl cis-trans isomerase
MTRAPVRRLVALALAAALVAAACLGGSSAAPIMPSGSPTLAPSVAPSGPPASQPTGAIPTGCPKSVPAPLAADVTVTVTLTTAKGDIVIQVKGALGPIAAANFVALAECGYYTNTVFHRLVPGFVIQGGDGEFGRTPNVDPSQVGLGGPGYEFADDPVTTAYTRGTVAMANSGPDTNGSQFFICLADVSLDPSYSIFGTVTSGMETVDAIAAMPNSGSDSGNKALDPVAITKTTVTRP